MIVFDLQCAAQHVFEGWFDSDDAYQQQRVSGLLACPLCGDGQVTKRLSAPRLNFGRSALPADVAPTSDEHDPDPQALLQQRWLDVARNIVATTDDVGDDFSHEARRIHYGEVSARAIRGRTSVDEAVALLEEGIGVLPLALPESIKHTLQ